MAERLTKPPIFEKPLLGLLRSAQLSASEMGHQYATLGHLAINLPQTHLGALKEYGLDEGYFAHTLPPGREKRDQRAELGHEILTAIRSARTRAQNEGTPTVSIDHLFESLVDPNDHAYITELRFALKADDPITITRKSKATTAA
jgi:hypothetical protein